MNIHSFYQFFMARFRPGRIRQLRQLCPEVDRPASVLDVGGSAGWWKLVSPGNSNITIVNIDDNHGASVRAAGFRFEVVDARRLPYADQSFDLVLSNSVIEHVGDWEDQKSFAAELLRVGRAVYVQTPNKWFFVEPHLIAPLLHWLPKGLQLRLIRWLSVWGWVAKPSREQVKDFVDTTRLLGKRELEALFPDCQILSERFLLMTKSFVIVRRPMAEG